VDLIATSTINVLMVRMAEETDHAEIARSLWHDTVCRLAFLLVPLAVFLVVMARPLIVGLFTETYAASVPIFTVWAVVTVLAPMLAVDGVLRVYAQTRFLLVMNLARLAFVAIFISAFMSWFGLPGAVLVTLIGTLAVKLLGAARLASLMRIPLWGMLPWARLAGITARALVAGVPAWWIAHRVAMAPLLAFFVGAAAYAAAYFSMAYVAALVPRKEKQLCAA
jgi:O-antigen/teichoic acid export membrane protein